jgi:hypothetical protein
MRVAMVGTVKVHGDAEALAQFIHNRLVQQFRRIAESHIGARHMDPWHVYTTGGRFAYSRRSLRPAFLPDTSLRDAVAKGQRFASRTANTRILALLSMANFVSARVSHMTDRPTRQPTDVARCQDSIRLRLPVGRTNQAMAPTKYPNRSAPVRNHHSGEHVSLGGDESTGEGSGPVAQVVGQRYD